MKKLDKNGRKDEEELMKSWTNIEEMIKINGLERKIGKLIKQNEEAMGDKIDNIKKKVQQFR